MPRSKKKTSSECDGAFRPCLKCRKEFCSTGCGNRLCKRCNDDNSRASKRDQNKSTQYVDME